MRLWMLNVGTGQGNTVLELTETFENVYNLKLNHSIGDRRPGDIAAIYADTSKIESKLGWTAKQELSLSLRSSWAWEKIN